MHPHTAFMLLRECAKTWSRAPANVLSKRSSIPCPYIRSWLTSNRIMLDHYPWKTSLGSDFLIFRVRKPWNALGSALLFRIHECRPALDITFFQSRRFHTWMFSACVTKCSYSNGFDERRTSLQYIITNPWGGTQALIPPFSRGYQENSLCRVIHWPYLRRFAVKICQYRPIISNPWSSPFSCGSRMK